MVQVSLRQKHLFLHQLTHQYDNRLFIELPAQYMKIPSSGHGENMGKTCCAHKLFWMSKQKQKQNNLCTQHVSNWNVHIQNWRFKEQSIACHITR